MRKEPIELGTIVLLEPGVELLHVIRQDQHPVRVSIYRDCRDGVCHWYELEFLQENGQWEVVFRVGDRKVQEAIDLLTETRDHVKRSPAPPTNYHGSPGR